MTYQVSEEGPVFQIDLLWVGRPTAVEMGWTGEACLAMVHAAEAVEAVNRGVGVGVLRNNDQRIPEEREDPDPDDPWVSRRLEAPWRNGPAWLLRDRRGCNP